MAEPGEIRAGDVMSSPVKTVDGDVSLREAAGFLSDNQISGAAVTDYRGKPVGVISLFDIAAYLAGLDRPAESPGGFYTHNHPKFERESEDGDGETQEEGSVLDETRVLDIMTPEIISVPPGATIREVASKLWKRRIHRVFVSQDDKLLGVISSLDVLRILDRGKARPAPKRKVRARAKARSRA